MVAICFHSRLVSRVPQQMKLVDSERLAWRSPTFQSQRDACLAKFDNWQEPEKLDFVKLLLASMCHQQHGSIDAFLKPMLKRDFIALLPSTYNRTATDRTFHTFPLTLDTNNVAFI